MKTFVVSPARVPVFSSLRLLSLPSLETLDLSPGLQQLATEYAVLNALVLPPALLLYLSIYAHVKGHRRIYYFLTLITTLLFWAGPWLMPIQCGPVRSLQNLAIAIGTMKMLDMFMRRNHLPRYTASKTPPSPAIFSLIILTELRYESFTPNHIRVPKKEETFSEPMQLAIHTGAFAVLQTLPQIFPTILAFEVLLAIYIIWTSLHLLLRYPNSPALFGPLYRAESLTLFWSETWHNAFTSPCTSLAYYPIRGTLTRLGVPTPIARSAGIIGAFALMGVFHMYALQPILPWDSLVRIGLFFFLNGIAAVCEAAVWGHKKSWLKTALAWTFETLLATWTAQAAHIPNGLTHIPWREMCDV